MERDKKLEGELAHRKKRGGRRKERRRRERERERKRER
jgi:hypothetical protein